MIKSYESIARDAGCSVLQFGLVGDWVWFNANNQCSEYMYPTALDAWAACVHENGLLPVEEE